MCGILGFFSHKPEKVPQELFYDRIEFLFHKMQIQGGSYNNVDGAGFYHPYIGVVKGNDEADNLVKTDLFNMIESTEVPPIFIGHTRKTTKGDSSDNSNNHPLWSDNYIIVHNGSVDSDDVTAKEFKLPGTVDSNLILAALEKYGPTDWIKHIKGLAAVIIAKRNDLSQIWVYRDTRPMFFYKDKYGLWIASTSEALKDMINNERKDASKNKNNLFEQILPIAELPNSTLYHFHKRKRNWVSTYVLTHALPYISTSYSKVSYGNTTTKEPEKLTPEQTLKTIDDSKYIGNYLSFCPNCVDKTGINLGTSNAVTTVCELCNSNTGVRNYKTELTIYPIRYRIKNWDDIPMSKIQEILDTYSSVIVKLPNEIVLFKTKKTLFVFFHSLKMTPTSIQIDMGMGKFIFTPFDQIHYPYTNAFITDSNLNWKICGNRFYYEDTEFTTHEFILERLFQEYNAAFGSKS